MRNFKKILVLLLSLSLMLSCIAFLIGCDVSEEETTEAETKAEEDGAYTVTLVDSDGAAVVGASIMITDSKSVFISGTTDQNGSFSAESDAEGLGVMIVSLPSGYEKPEAVSGALHAVFGDKKELSVTVKKETTEVVTYKVTVVDQNGKGVFGVELQLCPNGTCLADKFVTDENGVCTKDMKPNLPVDIKVVSLPDGYEEPDVLAESGGYHAKLEAGKTEITITVTKGNNE